MFSYHDTVLLRAWEEVLPVTNWLICVYLHKMDFARYKHDKLCPRLQWFHRFMWNWNFMSITLNLYTHIGHVKPYAELSWHQAISWSNVDSLSTGPWGTLFITYQYFDVNLNQSAILNFILSRKCIWIWCLLYISYFVQISICKTGMARGSFY